MSELDVIAVIGGMWGDEGKSKIIGGLTQDADLVIRANGGSNAGHTQVTDSGEKFVFHLVPSGILNPQTMNFIGAGTFVNPSQLMSELQELETAGITTSNVRISPKAHLTFEYHKLIESIEEERRGNNKIGSTGQGIGPTASDKYRRIGLRAGLLANPNILLSELERTLAIKRAEFPGYNTDPRFNAQYYEELIDDGYELLGPMLQDAREVISPILERDKGRIVLEGAQAVLLGIDHGTYPKVTSSDPGLTGLIGGSEVPASKVNKVIGVFKAYATRVGEGGFPTELKNGQGNLIRERGQEYGATTSRPRRVGWFDQVAASYSHWISGFTNIAITRLDTLGDCGEVRVCSSYRLNWETIQNFQYDDRVLSNCLPNYTEPTFNWASKDVEGARTLDDLPSQARDYCDGIMRAFPGARLSYVGVGPKNSDLIVI